MSYGTRKCLVCGKKFEAAYASQVSCSDECRRSRRQEQWATNKRVWWRRHKEEVEQLKARIAELEAQDKPEIQESKAMLQFELNLLKAKYGRQTGVLRNAIKRMAGRGMSKADSAELTALTKKCLILVAENKDQANKIKELEKRLNSKLPSLDQFKADYCKRLKLTALKLPCGLRAQCFNPSRCERCPEHASKENADD